MIHDMYDCMICMLTCREPMLPCNGVIRVQFRFTIAGMSKREGTLLHFGWKETDFLEACNFQIKCQLRVV